ncbi:hypothetical protein [Streptomyces sp. NPDC060027]|uniref:hypothetical protein n=1 Tax=Streptomyces sp. NPDC060027 TaxID=3347040 RepID=UPI0036A4FA82
MNGRVRARGLRRTVTAAAAAALVACVATGCRPMDTGAASHDDVPKAGRARHLAPAFPAEIPNARAERPVVWSDSGLTPR